jgi:hypothetical protein
MFLACRFTYPNGMSWDKFHCIAKLGFAATKIPDEPGFERSPFWPQTTPVKAVGFELFV